MMDETATLATNGTERWAAVTVSSGERREFGAGDVALFEDTNGEGHVSTPLTEDLAFAMIPTA